MVFRSVFSNACMAFALISSCLANPETSTATKVHYTCPCDGSESTTILNHVSTWNEWNPTFTNVDDSASTSHSTSIVDNASAGALSAWPSTWNLAPTLHCYTSIVATFNSACTTSTSSIITPCRITDTTTTTIVVTPATPTTTTTVTFITTSTASATTNVATDTATSTITLTTTILQTITSTSATTTTSTSTVTIQPSAGFLGVEATVPGTSNTDVTPVERDIEVRDDDSDEILVPGTNTSHWYQGDVKCIHYTSSTTCSTTVSTTTFTSTASAPVVITATETSTVTTLTTPGVDSTTTMTTVQTTTSTATSFTTETTTTTTTEIAASTPIFYAACDPNTNQAQYYLGTTLFAADFGVNPEASRATGATNPYDCCVAGLADPVAAVSVFTYNNNGCYLYYNPSRTCTNGQNSFTDNQLIAQAGPSPVFVASNLNCGKYDSGRIQTA